MNVVRSPPPLPPHERPSVEAKRPIWRSLPSGCVVLMDAFAGGAVDQRRGELARLLGLAEEIEALGGLISEECRRCSEQLARGGASARAAAAYATRARG